ncbi:MAG: ATP-binding protein [Gemmatimonadota bacterium]|nr:ATP-binding protein [Gemmatimonadota bacterium]
MTGLPWIVAMVAVASAAWAFVAARRARRAAVAAEERLSGLAEQLRQAQQLAIVGRLAGGVAHDFNNLLTVARTYCDLLIEETAQSDPRLADLLEIRRATDRAAMLARRLLSAGRAHDFDPRHLDLNETVRALQAMFGRTVPESVRLVARLEPGLTPVRGDAGLLELVVMNLVLNAIDAMPSGGTLTITTSLCAPIGDGSVSAVELTVSDTGTGMDDATQQHVFEPFFTTKEPGKGTGLGLSTVYAIVEQHGGRIRIKSELGRGTTFSLVFPVIAEIADSPRDPPAIGDGRAGGPAALRNSTDSAAPHASRAPHVSMPRVPSAPRA